jgi:hypothetical protein
MFRFAFSLLCCAVLVVAVGSLPASAQRPAAWDTRVRTSPPAAPQPADTSSASEPKDKTKKPVDAASGGKAAKPKPN